MRKVNLAPTNGLTIWAIYKEMCKHMPIERARSITRARIALERNIRTYYDPSLPIWPTNESGN